MPDGEELTGTSEAGLDLVGHEQDAVGVGDLAQPAQEARRRHDVAALAEDGLDDERGDLVGEDDLVEEQVEALLPVAGAGVDGVGAAGRPIAVRVVGVVDGAGQRLEVAAIDVLGAGQRHGLRGPAVEAAAEGDDGRPAGRHPGQLDGGLDGLGARVREEGAPWPAGQEVRQPLVQPQPGLVEDDVLLAVEQLHRLGGDGGSHARVGMPRVGHADARAVVEVAAAIAIDEPRAFASLDVDVRDPAPDTGHDRVVRQRRGGDGRRGHERVTSSGDGQVAAAGEDAGRRWYVALRVGTCPAVRTGAWRAARGIG